MNVDISSFVLLALALLPGCVAHKSSAGVISSARREKGFLDVTGEVLILDVAAHLFVAFGYAVIGVLAGLFVKHSSLYFVGPWFKLTPYELLQRLGGVPAGYLAMYFLLTLFAGWFVGLVYALSRVWRPMERFARMLDIASPVLGRFWFNHAGRFLVTGGPVVNQALFPALDKNGERQTVFVELVLKEKQGTLTGRVADFSIGTGADGHRVLYLEDVYLRAPGASQYNKLNADGFLVDTAQAVTIQIKQV